MVKKIEVKLPNVRSQYKGVEYSARPSEEYDPQILEEGIIELLEVLYSQLPRGVAMSLKENKRFKTALENLVTL